MLCNATVMVIQTGYVKTNSVSHAMFASKTRRRYKIFSSSVGTNFIWDFSISWLL